MNEIQEIKLSQLRLAEQLANLGYEVVLSDNDFNANTKILGWGATFEDAIHHASQRMQSGEV